MSVLCQPNRLCFSMLQIRYMGQVVGEILQCHFFSVHNLRILNTRVYILWKKIQHLSYELNSFKIISLFFLGSERGNPYFIILKLPSNILLLKPFTNVSFFCSDNVQKDCLYTGCCHEQYLFKIQ